MDENRKVFHNIFIKLNQPSYVKEDVIYVMFEQVLYKLAERMESYSPSFIPDSSMILSYVLGDYSYIMKPLSEEKRNEFLSDNYLINRLIELITDKIFFNEYFPYKSIALIDKYNPVISSVRFYLNFILNQLKESINNPIQKVDLLLLTMLKKAFLSIRSMTTLLIEGFETEAFSTWRTIHEIECITKIIFDNPYLIDVYERHMEYSSAFRNEYEDKEKQQSLIDELKVNLKSHDLKSKDLKKYIEYGWLYSINDVKEKYPDMKLNFRNGVEYISGLSSYSKLYEFSSEITHSSPVLIYSNKDYFLKLSIVCLYETFLRIESMFTEILKRNNVNEIEGFLRVRDTVLSDLIALKLNETEKFNQTKKSI